MNDEVKPIPWWTWPSRVTGMVLLVAAVGVPLQIIWWRSAAMQPRKEVIPAPVPGVQLRPKMLLLPAGSFWMGTNLLDWRAPQRDEQRLDEHPRHEVRIAKGFLLSETEVTQGQYQAVMGLNPSKFAKEAEWESRPVEQVSWFDAAEYCNRLTERELGPTERCYEIKGESVTWKDPECRGYRLPTEAEWEYAARADEATKYAGSNKIEEVAWFAGNSKGTTHPVKKRQRNAWFLYDLSGNVWEWVWDWYQADSKWQSPRDNPRGPQNGIYRVHRGGSWRYDAMFASVVHRGNAPPNARFEYVGIRLARSSP